MEPFVHSDSWPQFADPQPRAVTCPRSHGCQEGVEMGGGVCNASLRGLPTGNVVYNPVEEKWQHLPHFHGPGGWEHEVKRVPGEATARVGEVRDMPEAAHGVTGRTGARAATQMCLWGSFSFYNEERKHGGISLRKSKSRVLNTQRHYRRTSRTRTKVDFSVTLKGGLFIGVGPPGMEGRGGGTGPGARGRDAGLPPMSGVWASLA